MTSAIALPPLPDVAGAMRAYIRGLPGVSDVVGERVWIGWPRDADGTLKLRVPPYLHAVLIETGRGGLPAEAETPYLYERVDVSCLGPTEAEANALWRLVGAYLYDPRRRRPSSFQAANTQVAGVYPEGGPVRSPDPQTGWPRTWCGYQVRYLGVPVSEL